MRHRPVRRAALRGVALIAAGAGAAPAAAQLLQDARTVVVPPEAPLSTARSIFARDRGSAVAERMLPRLAAQGVTVGAFDLYPGLTVGGLYSSNVLADNRRRKDDVAAVIRPELTVRTSSGPYQLTAYGRGDFRRYATHGSENSEEGLGGVEGRLAIGALSEVDAGASYGTLIEPRYSASSPTNAARPLRYDLANLFAGATIEGASTRLVLRGDVARLRYRNAPDIAGGTLFTKDRDRERYQLSARLEHALSPAVSIYAAGSANKIDYRLDSVTAGGTVGTRDSRGFGAFLGASFEASALMRGDVRVGYIRQDFDLARLKPISGLGAFGTLLYFPNRLWTITAHAESSVEDSGVPGSGGLLHRGGSVRADYELRRFVVATVEGGYYRDTYRGLARRDGLPFVDAGITYVSRSHWNARLGYRYLARKSTGLIDAADFDDHRVAATLTFQI